MNIEYTEDNNSVIFSTNYKMITKIVKKQEEETYKAILEYCKENNIIPNLIEEEKLQLVLRLGMQELVKLERSDK